MASCRADHQDNLRAWANQVGSESVELARTLVDLSRGTDGYRVTLGNWSKNLYEKLILCSPIPPLAEAAKIFAKFQDLSIEMCLQLWQTRSGLHGASIHIPPTQSSKKPWFFAVRAGRVPGIYLTSAEASAQILGFKDCQLKKFRSREKAQEYIDAPTEPVRAMWTPG